MKLCKNVFSSLQHRWPSINPRNNTYCSASASSNDTLLGLSAALHADPETAFNEHRSVARVAAPLEHAGFNVQIGGFGLDTSLRAVFGTGSLSVGHLR